jgi:hypothetical protein
MFIFATLPLSAGAQINHQSVFLKLQNDPGTDCWDGGERCVQYSRTLEQPSHEAAQPDLN